jgi:hypothetical protein
MWSLPRQVLESLMEYTWFRLAAMHRRRSVIGSVSFQGMAHLLTRSHMSSLSPMLPVYTVTSVPALYRLYPVVS